MRYGTERPNEPFVAGAVTSLGLNVSVFDGRTAIPGMTGGDFNILLEKVELI